MCSHDDAGVYFGDRIAADTGDLLFPVAAPSAFRRGD